MNVHSTLNSYCSAGLAADRQLRTPRDQQRVRAIPEPRKLSKGEGSSRSSASPARPAERRSPVVGAKIIIGLIPCNVIPEEILTDHRSATGDVHRVLQLGALAR